MKFKLFESLGTKSVLFTLIGILSFSFMQAQTIKVTGSVTSEGEPLIGVNIKIKNTDKITISDFDGNYEINAKSDDVLIFDYLGYATKFVEIKGNAIVNTELFEDAAQLEEVVVVGYGLQTKKEATAAVARVNSEDIQKIATSDLGSAIQGQVSGVNVVASSGEPGESSNVQIRGLNSINGNNAPLYVVDGIPFDGDPKISNDEIESIDVLKDAASAAVYGTRGSGGVILITTKKGKEGVMKISLNSYYGVQKITSGTKLLNREDRLYADFASLRGLNGTVYGNTFTTVENAPFSLTNDSNLLELIENDNAPIQNHNINISGGKAGLSYNINASAFMQEGVIIKSNFKRYNIRANTQYTQGKWKVSTGMSSRIEDRVSPPWGLIREGIQYRPLSALIDPNSNLLEGAGSDPQRALNLSNLGHRLSQTNNSENHFFDFSLNAEYKILPSLTFTSRAAASFNNGGVEIINPNYIAFDDKGDRLNTPQSRVLNRSSIAKKTTWENILNYRKSFGQHTINLTAVYSAEQYKYSQFEASKFDIFNNKITTLDGATGESNVDSGSRNRWTQKRDNTLLGTLGRVQYNYGGRYLVGASLRRDGSSRFQKEHFGLFPSISLGWNVSEEAFWDPIKNFASSFKLRASRGTTGNQDIEDYTYAGVIRLQQDYIFGTDESLAIGAIQQSFPNQNVKWETSISNNYGFDLGLLKNKLTMSLDYYVTNKEDMLFPVEVALSNGGGRDYSRITRNVGNMTNKGLEYAVKYRHASGPLKWDVSGTFTANRNEITAISNNNEIIYFPGSTVSGHNNDSDLVTVIKKGYEAGAFFLHKTDGVVKTQEELDIYKTIVPTAELGDLRYVDSNNDGEITLSDRTYAGSGQPDFELGLNLNMNYKNFDLSVQMYGSFGSEILNGNKALAYKSETHQDLVYQWTPDFRETSVPLNRGYLHANYAGGTDYWLEDGSFVRLRNVVLGYTLKKDLISKIGLNRLRVYIASQNPLTFTKYTGYDPEVGGNGLSTRGIDRGNYPVSSQIRAGLQVQF